MKLTFDPKPSAQYPHGYWYASSEVTDCGAVGEDPASALAALIVDIETRWPEEHL